MSLGTPVSAGSPGKATALILSGQSVSSDIRVDGKLVGILIPSAWTAAALTFQGSVDGSTFANIYDDGTERTIASANVAVDRFLWLNLANWLPFSHIRIRSGTAAAAVNQAADRSLILALAG